MIQLPTGWKMKPLENVATLQRGFDLPIQARSEGRVRIFAANGQVGTHNVPKVEGPGVVTGRSGTLGKVHFVEEDFWPLNTALWVKNFHNNDPTWVYRLLSWMHLEKYTRGAGVPTLNRNLVHVVPVPLPPLVEQKRIAKILDAADGLRAKRRTAIAQLDTLLQSTFLDLFGDPVTNPKGWSCQSLKSVARIQTGNTPSSKKEGMFGGPIPFVTPGDLVESWVSAKRTLSEDGAKNSRVVTKGATLVCCIGATIGKMGKASCESGFNQQINSIEWIPECIDSDFGLEMMKFYKRKIAADGASTTLPILKKSLFEKIKVCTPPLDLQRQFASIVESVERQKARHLEQLAQLDTLFASLQQRAFKGEL